MKDYNQVYVHLCFAIYIYLNILGFFTNILGLGSDTKMPLTSAIQSAMAVRMEREKRHQRRLSKIRRESGAGAGQGSSIICTKRQSVASTATLEETPEAMVRPPPDKSESMVTTFHLGIVFILLGFIMILSSMIPSSIIKENLNTLLLHFC